MIWYPLPQCKLHADFRQKYVHCRQILTCPTYSHLRGSSHRYWKIAGKAIISIVALDSELSALPLIAAIIIEGLIIFLANRGRGRHRRSLELICHPNRSVHPYRCCRVLFSKAVPFGHPYFQAWMVASPERKLRTLAARDSLPHGKRHRL